MQMGLPLARIELADEVQVKGCNAYSRLSLAEQPTLFIEFHGSAAATREQVETFAEIARVKGEESSTGQSGRRSGASFGKPVMTPTGRRAACALAPKW